MVLLHVKTYKDRDYDVRASTTEDVGEVLLRVIDVITRSSGDGHPGLGGDTVELWFGRKKMLRSSKLSNYVGSIEKTKAFVRLQCINDGAPARIIDADAEKAMLAYYFRRQEEHKVMEAASVGACSEGFPWADPSALRQRFQALPHVALHPKHKVKER